MKQGLEVAMAGQSLESTVSHLSIAMCCFLWTNTGAIFPSVLHLGPSLAGAKKSNK